MIDITISKVPSFGTAKRVLTENPTMLADKQLIRCLAKAYAIDTAHNRNLWTDDYYARSAYGIVPMDMWLLSNIRYFIEEAKKEIEKRNIGDSFMVMIALNK